MQTGLQSNWYWVKNILMLTTGVFSNERRGGWLGKRRLRASKWHVPNEHRRVPAGRVDRDR